MNTSPPIIRAVIRGLFHGGGATRQIQLIQMPMGGIDRPSIALGILQASLQGYGISVQSLYANLAFAQLTGLKSAHLLTELGRKIPAPEWLFSTSAFRRDAPDEEESLTRVLDSLDINIADRTRLASELRQLRRLAESFIQILSEEVADRQPLIVGCTSVFTQHVASLAILRAIKEKNPNIITVLGGSNCETVMGGETHRAFTWVDYVFSGEADVSFADLSARIVRGEKEPDELPVGCYGPRHRRVECPITERIAQHERAILNDLNQSPTPAYDDYFNTLRALPFRELAKNINPTLPVETSRGCWWGVKHLCTFCGLNGEGLTFRRKSTDRVLDEFERLAAKYGVDKLEGVDNILDMRSFADLLPALTEMGAPYRIFFETKANLRRAQVRLFRSAGVLAIQPGIESLDDRVLALMNKGTTALQNIALLKWAKTYGLRVLWSILVGFPGEQDAWYEEMTDIIPLIVHLPPPQSFARIQYHRYSVYHKDAERYGLRLCPHQVYRAIYPDFVRLSDLVYLFEDQNEKVLSSLGLMANANGSGVEHLFEATERWRARARTSRPPSLVHRDEGNTLLVYDRRFSDNASEIVLEGLEAFLLRQADDVRGRNALYELAFRSEMARAAEEVDAAIRRLRERGLLLEVGRRLLALTTDWDEQRALDDAELPFGLVTELTESALLSAAQEPAGSGASQFGGDVLG